VLSRATTFDRRQRVVKLLHEQPGIRVSEIAQLLGVSEGTIRNDLNALAENGQLARVRGGAVPTDEHPGQSASFLARLNVRQAAKQRIARWAADLIEDGDSILLDASTTAYYIAPYLKDRHSLTIVTNGIEVGRKLAQNPSYTVILLGGVLRADGIPVTELLSEHLLRDLHIKTAFVSCAGFTPEAGATEADIHEAQLKSVMLAAAGSVVALIDSSKVGRVDLAPSARTEQVARIFTDSDLDPAWIERLRETCATLTICDENSVSDYTPCQRETRHYRIGFANLGEQVPFAVDVRRGLERAAREAGNIDLVLADNQLSRPSALQAADRLIAKEVDLAIEYQIDAGAADLIMARFRQARVPVVAVDIPMVGATFFGVDNYHSGYVAGEALGRWLLDNWRGQFDRLIMLEEPRAGSLPAARLRGQLEGLQGVVGEVSPDRQICLDSGNTLEISQSRMEAALASLPAHFKLAVLSFNDDAAVGAISAARKLGRASQIAVVGQGADRLARSELRRSNSPLIGSTAYFPERYGQHLLALADRILRQEPVPPAVYVDHAFITADNVDRYYPES
jgi:ribose transport system substrate-binding protein